VSGFKNGLLTVTIPKAKAAQARKIEIGVTS
jgi:HSP20 family molecular chaperone IbpA